MDFFRQLFDDVSSTYTYVLADLKAGEGIIIDPVLEHLDEYVALVNAEGFQLKYALDTHVHADHVTASGRLREQLGAQTCVSASAGVPCAGVALGDGDVVRAGSIEVEARQTPGHTAGCMSYVVHAENMAFTGDALLIEGSGRTDFQQGDARQLYRSVHDKILSLPNETVLYPGHDYKGRKSTTVAHEKENNPRLGMGKSEDDFVAIMEQLKLAYPRQIDRALPLNMRCGIENVVPLSAAAQRSATGVLEVTPQWVLDNKARVRLVDVREQDEFEGPLSHIRDAELVPMAMVETAAAGWSKAERLVLVCRSGGRSGRAAATLEAMGFEQAASLAGGMLAWNHQGLPTVEVKNAPSSSAQCG